MSFSNVPAAIELLKKRKECLLEKDWTSIRLEPAEYNELWLRLERDEGDLLNYIEDKVQYEKKLSLNSTS